MFHTDGCGNPIGRLDPVEQGQYRAGGTDQWAEACAGCGELPTLHGQHDEIYWANRCRIIRHMVGMYEKITGNTLDTEAMGADCRKVCPSRNEGDVVPSLHQPGPKVATNPSRSDDSDTHRALSSELNSQE
jgi:hypothetical protein